MPSEVTFGITVHSGTLIDSVDTDKKCEKKELKGSTGAVKIVKAYNKTTDFTVKGHGTNAVVPGVGESQISTVTGGVSVIDSVKESETNEDFSNWEYSGTNYPEAVDHDATEPPEEP